jgi:ATP-dependent RNA helicase DeaD
LTTETLVEPAVGFQALSLQPALLDALDRAGYRQPTPIQAALIPHALQGRDAIGQAQTGTGKTAAFVLPFINRWTPDTPPGPQAIILAPTRELVVQVADEARKLCPFDGLNIVTIYGGTRISKQIKELRDGAHMIVGTPGRVLDHLARGTLKLDRVNYAVLDEADRMLDIGFRPDIERILKRCPKERQTLLLSATLSEDVLKITHRYMVEPVNILLSPDVLTVDKIRQTYITVDEDRKFELLCRILERDRPRQAIIFCSRKRWADDLYRHLAYEFPDHVATMHGDLEQSKREKIMQDFRDAKVNYLVATDVVGRGIDVCGISHVINYDLPEDIENYVHRIGRTGRMGADGIAIAFATPEQGKLLTAIELAINRQIPEDKLPGFRAFVPRPKEKPAEPAEPPKKPFGKRGRKYSNRL